MVKRRSALFAEQEQMVRFGRANLLASYALFDDDPGKINTLEEEFAKGHAGADPEDRARMVCGRRTGPS